MVDEEEMAVGEVAGAMAVTAAGAATAAIRPLRVIAIT
jgi:hypothetical protein